jgi:hypothetical protein
MYTSPNLMCYVDWKYVRGCLLDQFEEICGLEKVIEDDVMTLF